MNTPSSSVQNQQEHRPSLPSESPRKTSPQEEALRKKVFNELLAAFQEMMPQGASGQPVSAPQYIHNMGDIFNEIVSLVRDVQYSPEGAMKSVTLTLNPEQLGAIEVTLVVRGHHHVDVSIMAETEVKKILRVHQPMLEQRLMSAGLRTDVKIERISETREQ